MAVLVGAILVGGVIAAVANFTTDVDHTAKVQECGTPSTGITTDLSGTFLRPRSADAPNS